MDKSIKIIIGRVNPFRSPATFFGSELEFLRKTGSGFSNAYRIHVKACQYSDGRDGHRSDSESKIWRLTGFGAGFLVFGADFGVNFSDSAHLCTLPFFLLFVD